MTNDYDHGFTGADCVQTEPPARAVEFVRQLREEERKAIRQHVGFGQEMPDIRPTDEKLEGRGVVMLLLLAAVVIAGVCFVVAAVWQ